MEAAATLVETRGTLADLLHGPRPQRDHEGRDNYLAQIAGHLVKVHSLDDAAALVEEIDQRFDEPLGRQRASDIAASIGRSDERKMDALTENEYRRERARHHARERLHAELAQADMKTPPSWHSLQDELALDDEPIQYTVEGLLPESGNAVLAAQFKAGKTTLLGNIARALADGLPCLGRLAVSRVRGRIAIWNHEMEPRQFRDWLRTQGFLHPEHIVLLHLKGYGPALISPPWKAWAIDWLRANNVSIWFIDPWAPLVGACGLNENANEDVVRLTHALDEIKREAGVEHIIITAHTGRAQFELGAERVRGATRLDDWADVRWILTRDSESDQRFFSANGRDVDLGEMVIKFDPETRHLTLQPGSRRLLERTRHIESAVTRLGEIVAATPGISAGELRGRLGIKFDPETRHLTLQPGSRRLLERTRHIESAVTRLGEIVAATPGISAGELRGRLGIDNRQFATVRQTAIDRGIVSVRVSGNAHRHYAGDTAAPTEDAAT